MKDCNRCTEPSCNQGVSQVGAREKRAGPRVACTRMACPGQPLTEACICQEGYVRRNNGSGADCVPPTDCPKPEPGTTEKPGPENQGLDSRLHNGAFCSVHSVIAIIIVFFIAAIQIEHF